MVRLVVNRIPPICPLNYAGSIRRRFGLEWGNLQVQFGSRAYYAKISLDRLGVYRYNSVDTRKGW